jgi:hypothetical protein
MAVRRGPATATELLVERDRRYREDAEYREAVDRAEAERVTVWEQRREAERPFIADLEAHGVQVGSAWDLCEHPDLNEVAYPILLKHLQRDYPGRVLNGMARGFLKQTARSHWVELLDLYLMDPRAEVRDGLAATLSGCAVRSHYEDLLAVLANESLGESRIYFLRPVNRIGNRKEPGVGRTVIERFADHPQLGTEATLILARRGPND